MLETSWVPTHPFSWTCLTPIETRATADPGTLAAAVAMQCQTSTKWPDTMNTISMHAELLTLLAYALPQLWLTALNIDLSCTIFFHL